MIKSIILITLLSLSLNSWANDIAVIGKVPGEYLGGNKNKSYPAVVVIKDKIIKKIQPIPLSSVPAYVQKLEKIMPVVLAGKNGKLDVLYPGLIDLHNHTKQNMIPVWDDAKGQFANRFEWRGWGGYKQAVSGNMNPWIGYGKPIVCAAFRWSELQAMVVGTAYLQGPSSCITNFSIHKVEDKKAYLSPKLAVGAPTDFVIPGDMTYVWEVVRPEMKKLKEAGKPYTYSYALKSVLLKTCPDLTDKIDNVLSSTSLKILKDKKKLYENCGITDSAHEKELIKQGIIHKKFVRYVYWVHPSIASKIKYLADPKQSAVITHLAEGRRNDPYNKLEFTLMWLLTSDLKKRDKIRLNFVHGGGIDKKGFKYMKEKGMGLVWSPFSNFLLYNETANVVAAKKAGVTISLGADWVPTGSRSVLEELKLVKAYIEKDPFKEGLKKYFNDEDLYKMVTENPARQINHFEDDPNDDDHGIGTLKVSAMGTLIAVKENNSNPYTNLVMAWAKDVNLMVIDGKAIYGNRSYMEDYNDDAEYEVLSENHFDYSADDLRGKVPVLTGKPAKADKAAHLVKLGKIAAKMKLANFSKPNFEEEKVMVQFNTLEKEKDLQKFYEETGLNLDRFQDIHKLIGLNLMSQTRNLNDPKEGKIEKQVSYVQPLYARNDLPYLRRLLKYIIPGAGASSDWKQNYLPTIERLLKERITSQANKDEVTENEQNRARFSNTPVRMAEVYGLPYDSGRNY